MLRHVLRLLGGWLLAGFLLAGPRAAAAEADREPRCDFEVPAGDAIDTLKLAARQAGVEIVFFAETVRGVRTPALHGSYRAREAFERLVAGMELVVVAEARHGMLAIQRGGRAAPEPAGRNGSLSPHDPMKRKNPLAALGSWLALAFTSTLPAQAAEPAAAVAARTAAVTGRIQNVVTGQYLNNARVTVRGTDLVAFTDQSGTYRLPQVPAGTVTLDVFYTGLDAQSAMLEAAAGRTATRDFELTSAARFGPDGVVQLDAFTVATARETDGHAIAVNEQRFAPNVKNVVAADLMGDVMDGNVGEFLKFLPGITADYDNEDGSTIAYISVRGFSSGMTTIATDGAQMASTSTTFGDSRQFSFNSTSINNIARVEVTKVPTPANPADSLAGSVNLITKSAFERKNAQLRYNVNLTGNNENLVLGRQAHTTEEEIFKILPGANFDYTLPINNRLGLVLTGLTSRRYTKQHRSTTSYSTGGTATGASVTAPYLGNYQMFNSPRVISRDSLGFKVDWRVTRNGVLSAGAQWSHYESQRLATQFTVNAGTTGTSAVAGGVPLTFGPDFVHGATGRGTVSMGGAASVHPDLTTRGGNVRYRHDDGRWRVQVGYDTSVSSGGYQGTEAGNFRQFGITSTVPLRVNFRGSDPVRPDTIELFDNANQPWNMNDLRNYTLNTANSTPRATRDELETWSGHVRRTLDFLALPAALEFGASQRDQTRDIRRYNINWTYNGVGGDRTPAPYASRLANNRDNYYGFTEFPHVSPQLAWQAYERNAALFSKTPAQIVTEETFRITNSLAFEERVTALYLQGEASFLKSRLRVLTGARYEKTEVAGVGPLVDVAAVWQRNRDGSFVRNAAGQRVRRPEAGAANSLEQLALTHAERAARNAKTYDGYYPSVHLTYNLTGNLLARAAYAKTYGRPNLGEVFPNTTIDEFDVDDPNAIQGNITVTNPALKPWRADNYDLSLEYYTDKGGLFTVGVFQKDIRDFFGSAVFIATAADLAELGLEDDYVNWRVTTRRNVGDAEVLGAEFSVRQSLAFLGPWGRPFSGFVNGTKLDLKGDRIADFAGFVPETLNYGLTFSRKPVLLMMKWNYRGKQRNGAQPAFGPDAFTYQERRLALDVNFELQVRRDMFLFVNAQNVFNAPYITQIYGSRTPDYAKRSFTNHNGVGLTLGLKGSF
jgi:TonB-dependent receptor